MRKLAHSQRARKQSNVGAVGVTSCGPPGERAKGSPHGSDVRRGAFLTLDTCPCPSHLGSGVRWQVVLVEQIGCLPALLRTVLVDWCVDAADAASELASWSHALNLPWRDYGAPPSETNDPVAGWPR
jgi:hypothetical protein